MGYMPAVTVEIAFDSNFNTAAVDRTWTDVSAYVELSYGIQIERGRSDEFSNCEPSRCTLTLDNRDGRFTAGNTSGAYYPNVKIGRPIRVTTTPVGGSASVRFTGYIDEWPVEWPDATDSVAVATISATSRTARLGLSTVLDGTEIVELLADNPVALYQFDEVEGSTSAADTSGNGAPALAPAGTGAEVLFGGQDDSGVPLGATFQGGKWLETTLPALSTWTIEVMFRTAASADLAMTPASPGVMVFSGSATDGGFDDGGLHSLALSRDGSDVLKTYVDGVLTDTGTSTVDLTKIVIGGPDAPFGGSGQAAFVGTVTTVAVYGSAVSGARIADHFGANAGFVGETTGDRLERYAGYVGIPVAEVDTTGAVATMGLVDTQGLAVVDAFRVVESTEGGVLFDGRNGDLVLQGRRHRHHAAVDVTLSMTTQQVEADYRPKLDRSALKNDITATDAGVNIGTAVTARAVNQTSVDEYGEASGSIMMASDNANEAHSAATFLVALYGEPSPRAPDLRVDFLPLDLSLQTDLMAADISSRFQLTGRPSQAGTSTVDYFIEGYTEEIAAFGYEFTFHTSPAHAAYDAIFIVDDPVYGLLDSDNLVGF